MIGATINNGVGAIRADKNDLLYGERLKSIIVTADIEILGDRVQPN